METITLARSETDPTIEDETVLIETARNDPD